MGTRRQREKQEGLWIAQQELASAPGHPSYQKVNELLEAERFDEFVENRCAKFYAAKYGRPSLTPGIYFRSLLIGYFEGIGGSAALPGGWRIRWRCGRLWASRWMSTRRIIRRSRARED
jgi:transposase